MLGPASAPRPAGVRGPSGAGCPAATLSRVADRGHYRRYRGYDYSRGAEVFATVSTSPRAPLFGAVREARVSLSPLGALVEKHLFEAADHVAGIVLRSHVVMPDHVHVRFRLEAGLPAPTRTMGAFMGRFKQLSQWAVRQAGGPPHLWEEGYHDHLCLSRQMIEAVDRYLANNPLKWWLMHGDRSLLHVREPLADPWLSSDVFWRGVGRWTPRPGQRLVSLRVSRRLSLAQQREVAEVCLRGAARGDVYVSTFFSPGEHLVYRTLAEKSAAPLIHLRAPAVHWAYRPTGLEPQLFAAGRLLVLARMEATDDPARRADLLWLNAKAQEIALGAGGVAVYARPGAQGILYRAP